MACPPLGRGRGSRRAERRWLLVASNAGDDRHPAWWHNLRASPRAAIQVGRECLVVRARTAEPAERQGLLPRIVAVHARYADYEQRKDRGEIPVVTLERASEA